MSVVQLDSPMRCKVWRVDLDVQPAPEAAAALSEEEWERARRFVFARDRHRYVAAHAALRSVLAGETGLPAGFLDFNVGAFGKPALVEPAGLRFNLSHSQSVALIAVGEDADIGVDIEMLRSMPDAITLAQTYFSLAERQALEALEPAGRERAFLVCWTRKEACLKATGMGLNVDTRSFDVGIDELGGEVRELHIESDQGAAHLTLSSFDGGAGVVCAAARVLSYATQRALPRRQERELYA